MPIYEYSCSDGHKQERYFKVSDQRTEKMPCSQCAKIANFVPFPAPSVKPDYFRTYFEPSLGEVVSSASQMDSIAKKHGLVAERHHHGALP